ncbi:hypothetical protein [Promineifilum sp.]|uniref:hypothetical protein n=1 Tax=Promineifilum sp. TaxID=2664178 RepID=UPI0035B28C82
MKSSEVLLILFLDKRLPRYPSREQPDAAAEKTLPRHPDMVDACSMLKKRANGADKSQVQAPFG